MSNIIRGIVLSDFSTQSLHIQPCGSWSFVSVRVFLNVDFFFESLDEWIYFSIALNSLRHDATDPVVGVSKASSFKKDDDN